MVTIKYKYISKLIGLTPFDFAQGAPFDLLRLRSAQFAQGAARYRWLSEAETTGAETTRTKGALTSTTLSQRVPPRWLSEVETTEAERVLTSTPLSQRGSEY